MEKADIRLDIVPFQKIKEGIVINQKQGVLILMLIRRTASMLSKFRGEQEGSPNIFTNMLQVFSIIDPRDTLSFVTHLVSI